MTGIIMIQLPFIIIIIINYFLLVLFILFLFYFLLVTVYSHNVDSFASHNWSGRRFIVLR